MQSWVSRWQRRPSRRVGSANPAANYYLIYSKPEYKELNKEIESLSKKVEAQKEDAGALDKKRKKQSNFEGKLQTLQRDMTFMKMKSTILISIFTIVTLSSLGNYYQGKPVARLPFQPFSLLSSITHRGLVGDDLTECSYIFVYLLASYLFRADIQAAFGFETKAAGSANPFFPMPTAS